ncbi:MAG: hypothetical protein QOJ70_3788 [Acidobacteriota bacterium]|jgi:hypothetical protein|nr:hypothetical protein [Acidobacteriota bacterium]
MRKYLAVAFVLALLAAFAVGFTALRAQKAGKPTASKKGPDAVASVASDAKRAPVVVELFTSEGCSSCPPADALLARLDKTQPVEGAEVIPLAMHVDYWNQLGWADPFSSHEFSERQDEYARAYGKDGVYTPQMIVDGVKEFPGGDSTAALNAVGNAARAAKADVRLTRAALQQAAGDVRLSVHIENLPALAEGDAAYVLLAVTESDLASDVARGENAGHRLSHVGVVRLLTTLGGVGRAGGGTFDTEATVPIAQGWRRENLRAVVFAQERTSRRVLAAASLKLFD